MARTILAIALEVCDRAVVNRPSSLFGNNDRIARILRVAAKDTLRDIMRDAMRNGVSGFNAQWVFATHPGIYAYRQPPDIYRLIEGTEQRQRWPLGILGPVNPQTWSNWVSGLGMTSVPMGWRLKNNLIHIEPPPSSSEIVVIEYLSRFMVARDATDADLAPIGGYLQPIAPLVPREGYLGTAAMQYVDTEGSAWGWSTWGTAVWGPITPDYELRRIPADVGGTSFPPYQVRAEEFTADTDTSALDDDHILALGMTWRLLKGLGMPYAGWQDEYEREKDVYLSNDASRGRTFVFGNVDNYAELVPLGDGNWRVS